MKNYSKYIYLFIISFHSCNAEKGNSIISVDKTQRLVYGRNYYWEKSDPNRFIALSFDSTDNTYCTLYSFGNKERENEKRYLVESSVGNIYELSSLDSGKIEYEVKITADKSLSLSTTIEPFNSYTMIIDDSFQNLFGKVMSRFRYKCVSSDEIIYNQIIAYKTMLNEVVKKSNYKRKTESYDDEIYGSGKNNYLDFNGNRFYYSEDTGREEFYKIEIVNNKMDSLYLDIKIGDKKSEVAKKLSISSKSYKVTNSEIILRICNAKYEGGFGYLKFKFTNLKDTDPVLKSIDYNPYYDGE